MASLLDLRKRFCGRVLGDVPADLAALLCEDPIDLLRHHVPRLVDGIARHTEKRRPAYAHAARFSIPGSPASSRLRSPEGFIPFHFAKNVVEGRTAQEFDAYARGKGRDAAPVTVEQDENLETVTSIDGTARDAYMRGHGGPDGTTSAGWTNLQSPTDWNVVEAFERDRRRNPDGNPPGISIFYDRAPELFDDVERQPECPAGLSKLIRKEQARVAAGRPSPPRKERDGVRYVDDRAFDIYAWLKTRPSWPAGADKATRPVRVSEGRAAQTHVAGEGEYHAGLDQSARDRVLAGVIVLVRRQRNSVSEADDGWFVPMTVCSHVPDGLNDPLNDHFHWLIGTRRARYDADGKLEFEPAKVNAITRNDWIDVMRHEVARLTNIELAAIGAKDRYHPGTLPEMGIDATAQQKMHGNRWVLERAGVSTTRGLSNDTEGWRRAFAVAAASHSDALAAIDREGPAGDPRQSEVRAVRTEAADLRHEAAQIGILIDMSRSRSARTARFAPEYAAKAKAGAAADGWLARGAAAERHLRALDSQLGFERDEASDRLKRAESLEAQAVALLAPASPAQSHRSPAHVPSIDDVPPSATVSPTPVRDLHRMVDIIAHAPLLVHETDGRFLIAPQDDPDGLAIGIDLSPVQSRLAAIRRSQQRELAQVQAFVRRHGADALRDDTAETHSGWFRKAVRQWRDTPVMQRFIAERDTGLRRERTRDVQRRDVHRRYRKDVHDLDQLRWMDEVPFLADLIGDQPRATEVAPSVAQEEVITVDAAKGESGEIAGTIPMPSSLSSEPPKILWSELEERHRAYVAWQSELDRRRTNGALERAFLDRIGENRALTPYAARLLGRVADGFMAAGIPEMSDACVVSLDHRDAAEIIVLSHDRGFRALVEAAGQQDPATLRAIAAARPASTGPDLLGRVPLDRGRLRFAPAPSGSAGELRTPLEWAERTVAVVIERQMPLTRQEGLVGIHDRDVLRLSHYNYLGLLHPAVQHRLEAERRMQIEVERGILHRVSTGTLRIETQIERDRTSNAVMTQVRLIGGTPEANDFVDRRQTDPDFYFRCREAASAISHAAEPLRHAHAVVRAWLAARDDGAARSVIDVLGREILKLNPALRANDMTGADAAALATLLTPPRIPPPATAMKERGRRPGPPLHPGRSSPGR